MFSGIFLFLFCVKLFNTAKSKKEESVNAFLHKTQRELKMKKCDFTGNYTPFSKIIVEPAR